MPLTDGGAIHGDNGQAEEAGVGSETGSLKAVCTQGTTETAK